MILVALLAGCGGGGGPGSSQPVILDRDGDGVVDRLDAFPDDPSETLDTDADGSGDNRSRFDPLRRR